MFKIIISSALLCWLIVSDAFALTQINVSIINRKGMDHGFDLVDELHVSELFERDKPLRFRMSNGLEVRLKLKQEEASEGHPIYFNLEGEVIRSNGSKIAELNENPVRLNFTDPLNFEVKDANKQIVLITIRAIEIAKKK